MKHTLRLLLSPLCALLGHRWSSWQLITVYYGREITKDATRRSCACCGASQAQVIPFRRFTVR